MRGLQNKQGDSIHASQKRRDLTFVFNPGVLVGPLIMVTPASPRPIIFAERYTKKKQDFVYNTPKPSDVLLTLPLSILDTGLLCCVVRQVSLRKPLHPADMLQTDLTEAPV